MAVISDLKQVRLKAGCSQRRMAEDLGISVKTISNIECGLCSPSLEIALLISDYLHQSVDDLFHIQPLQSVKFS